MNKKTINKIILTSAVSILVTACGTNSNPATSTPKPISTPTQQAVSATQVIIPCKSKCGSSKINPGKNNVIYDNHIFSEFAFNYIYNGNPGFTRVSSQLAPNPIPSTKVAHSIIQEQYAFIKKNHKKLPRKSSKEYRIESYVSKKGILTTFYVINKKPVSLISAASVRTKNIVTNKIEGTIGIQGLYYKDIESYKAQLPKMLKHFLKMIQPPKKK